MCKTCGCAAGTQQLWLEVSQNEQSAGLQRLYADLIGAPGVLQVTTDEKSGQVTIDFNPQSTSQQELELRVTESGYAMTGAKIRTPAHQHSISGFFKKLLGQSRSACRRHPASHHLCAIRH